MTYVLLSEADQKDMLKNRLHNLEREHYNMTLSLLAAEAAMEAEVKGASLQVIEINQQLKAISLSIKALGELASK